MRFQFQIGEFLVGWDIFLGQTIPMPASENGFVGADDGVTHSGNVFLGASTSPILQNNIFQLRELEVSIASALQNIFLSVSKIHFLSGANKMRCVTCWIRISFSLYRSIPRAKDTTHASIHVAFPSYTCEPNNEVDRLNFSYMLSSLMFISVMRFQYVKDERDIIFT